MNETTYQAVTRAANGETTRETFASFREAFEAIWPAMEAAGIGTNRGADGSLHDRTFIFAEMMAGVAFIDGRGDSRLIVNSHSNAFVAQARS